MAEPARSGRLRAATTALALLLAALLLLRTAAELAVSTGADALWDDSYMYVRYADHLLGGHGVRWNLDDPPAWGLTSLLYLAPVALLRTLAPASDHAAILAASFGSGIVALLLLLWLAWRMLRGERTSWIALVVVAFGLLWRPAFVRHFPTGMDTTFAIAALAAFLLLLDRTWPRGGAPTRRTALVAGAAGGLLFLVRPDLLLFPAGVIAARFAGAWRNRDRLGARRAAEAGAAFAGLLALELLAARLYFGAPLPLPFYAKSTGLYGPDFRANFAGVAGSELRAFVELYAPLLLLALSPLLGGVRRMRAAWGASELGLLAATIAYGAYFRFLVLPVMPYSQRFFHPTLPALVLLAARAAAAWIREPPRLALARPRLAALLGALALAVGVADATPTALDVLEWATTTPESTPANEAPTAAETSGDANAAGWRAELFAARELPELPDDLVVAGTDIGYLGLRARRKRVVDLAALNDADFARHGFSAERLLGRDRPDLLYLPHRYFTDMRRTLLRHPTFQAEYELFDRKQIRGIGVALRKTGPHYARLRAWIDDWRVPR
jgi:hypothetical protein